MGYQDRDYFRNAHYPYLELIRSTRVCWGIVILHTLVFLGVLVTQTTAYPLGNALRLDPTATIEGWQWHRVLTASLVVDEPWHLIFALVLIWVLGHELEQMLGGSEFLAFYILCLVLGNVGQTLVYHYALPVFRPMQVGPSSAALGVLMLAVLHFPYRTVPYLLLPMPMWVFGALAAVFEVFFFLSTAPWHVQLAIHAAPLAFTVLYYQLNWRLIGAWARTPRLRRASRRQLAPVLSAKPKPSALREEAPEPAPLTLFRPVDEQLEAKMDAILEKVSKTGMDSLTPEEKNILKRASEELRRKRH
jgi:membrane associated rhomboid family serine protease